MTRSLRRRAVVVTVAIVVGCRKGPPSHADHASSATRPPGQTKSEARALDDPAIQHEMVSFKSGADTIQGYLAHPKAPGKYRAVVVLHGEFGAPEGQRNLGATLAQNGFVALVAKRFDRWPTLTPEDVARSDQTDKRFRSGSFNWQEVRDAQAAIDFLQSQPYVIPGGVGVIGFCGGGYQALLLATRSPDVKAAVVFYAPPEALGEFQNPKDPKPSLIDKVAQIRVPVQGHFGADDPFVPLDLVGKFEQALKAHGTPVSFFVYPRSDHGFYDYTRRSYNPEASAQARGRMLEFLKERLEPRS